MIEFAAGSGCPTDVAHWMFPNPPQYHSFSKGAKRHWPLVLVKFETQGG
jgi:hypothetical protein